MSAEATALKSFLILVLPFALVVTVLGRAPATCSDQAKCIGFKFKCHGAQTQACITRTTSTSAGTCPKDSTGISHVCAGSKDNIQEDWTTQDVCYNVSPGCQTLKFSIKDGNSRDCGTASASLPLAGVSGLNSVDATCEVQNPQDNSGAYSNWPAEGLTNKARCGGGSNCIWSVKVDVPCCPALTTASCGSGYTSCGDSGGGRIIEPAVEPASITADPHFTGFDGTKYEFMGYQGAVFNLITQRDVQMNALFDRLPGPAMWPYWGTWMTALGLRLGNNFNMELRMNTSEVWSIKNQTGNQQLRMQLPQGGFKSVVSIAVNGEDQSANIESGSFMKVENDVIVHFPNQNQKHVGDPSDGPLVVVTTETMQITFYLETEDATHLDMSLKLLGGFPPNAAVHGVLGQTVNWARDSSMEKQVEGTDENYHVKDGLLGTDFDFNLFGKNGVRKSDNWRGRAIRATGPDADGLISYTTFGTPQA